MTSKGRAPTTSPGTVAVGQPRGEVNFDGRDPASECVKVQWVAHGGALPRGGETLLRLVGGKGLAQNFIYPKARGAEAFSLRASAHGGIVGAKLL